MPGLGLLLAHRGTSGRQCGGIDRAAAGGDVAVRIREQVLSIDELRITQQQIPH